MKSRPEVLPLRNHTPREYEQVDSFATARNTNYLWRANKKDTLYATQLTGEYPRELRQLNLIQTRHSISHLMESKTAPQNIIAIADQIRLNKIFAKTFENSDPYQNYNAREIVALVASPEQIKISVEPLVLEFARTIGTTANAKLLRSLTDEKTKELLKNMKRNINRELKELKNCLLAVNEDRHYYEQHEDTVEKIAQIIMQFGKNKRSKPELGAKQPPDRELMNQKWCELMPAYPKLDLTHSGRMNRRRRANEIGKSPKYLSRLLTDPNRRIFAKKSKSLGGVVVIDCSGSMGLTDQDIDRLVNCASGSTIWAYSSTCRGYESENTWLVAHKGKRMRGVPKFHGGNGVDLPALALAKRYRKNKTDMMIWISDGCVTGNGDSSDKKLRRATAHFIRKNDIHHVEEIHDAIKLMSDAQKGKKRKRIISNWEKFALDWS